MTTADVDGYFFYEPGIVRKNPVFVEVGAYTDHAVRPLKAAYPTSRMLVVEASPTCLESLREYVVLYEGVQVLPAALAREDGPVAFYEFKTGPDGFSVFDRSEQGLVVSAKMTAKGMRLSSLLREAGLSEVDLLMLNCEGAELFALEEMAASSALRGVVRQVGVSFHCEYDVVMYEMQRMYEALAGVAAWYDVTMRTTCRPTYYLLVRRDLKVASVGGVAQFGRAHPS